MKRMHWRVWLVVVVSAVLVACGGGGGGSSAPTPPPPPPAPPTISTQPQAATADDGGTASFSVSASGSGTLHYQWSRNDQTIAGATAASYTTPALTLADHQANYRVTVSNDGGSVTSSAAVLTVRPMAPSIDMQPVAATVADGDRAVFSIRVQGSRPLAYQWLRNGQPIEGALGESYTVETARLGDSGATFSVRVSNAAGQVLSASAALQVTPIPVQVTQHPQAQTTVDGGTANFAVSAKGSGTLQYQWLADGKPIVGATAASYTLTAGYTDNAKRFSVQVSSPYGSTTSEGALLTVTPLAPTPPTELRTADYKVGEAARLSVTSGGTKPLTYQWERSTDAGSSWRPVAGATNTEFEVPRLTLAWADVQLRVKVSNVAGTVASAPVLLRVQPNVRVVAGRLGGEGNADGQGNVARFGGYVAALAVHPQGQVIVADTNNAVLRSVSSTGQVSTFAGQPGTYGHADGPVTNALFGSIFGVAVASDGTVYVADGFATIRRITPGGVVSTLAGKPFEQGHRDGKGSDARFRHPRDLALDSQGRLLVVDNYTVRRVSLDGDVVTLAGKDETSGYADGPGVEARFTYLTSVAVGPTGDIFVGDQATIRRIDASGTVTRFAGVFGTHGSSDGYRLAATFASPGGLCFDAQGRLYVGQAGNAVRRIDPDGQVYTLAGYSQWTWEEADGQGAAARFYGLNDMAASPDRSIFYTAGHHTVRMLQADGTVRTLAGRVGTSSTGSLGTGEEAAFNVLQSLQWVNGGYLLAGAGYPYPVLRISAGGQVDRAFALSPLPTHSTGAAWRDAGGNTYLLSPFGSRIDRIDSAGRLTLFSGDASNQPGDRDGDAAQAKFNRPVALTGDGEGNLYVVDENSYTVRKVTAQGRVSTLAGTAGSCGHRDGPGAEALFCRPTAILRTSSGDLLVADTGNHVIRRVTPDGKVSTLYGTPRGRGFANGFVPQFAEPNGLALDSAGNLYVSERGNSVVRRITPEGFASVVMGTGLAALRPGLGGSINRPYGVVVDANDRLFVLSEYAVVGD